MRPCTALLLALPVLLGAAPSRAGELLDLQIISRTTGLPLQTYAHRGQRYVIGVPGEGYTVRLINRGAGRVLGVVSVDGINAITGDTAGVHQSGYVLGPYEIAEITGWRKSMEEVARFYFTRLPDSYAARTDRPGNAGVIGVAAYAEQVAPPAAVASPPASAAREQAGPAAQSAPSGEAAAPAGRDAAQARAENRLGTGHGERETAPTRYTEFRRASTQPAEILTVRYDSRARLVRLGILPAPAPRPPAPQPFPARFVPDPGGRGPAQTP